MGCGGWGEVGWGGVGGEGGGKNHPYRDTP